MKDYPEVDVLLHLQDRFEDLVEEGMHLATGKLVPVLPSYTHPVLPLHAITPTAKHVNLKTRLFIQRLTHEFASPPPWDRWQEARNVPKGARD